MRHWTTMSALLCLWANLAWAQAPPPKYTDGTITCRPAYSVQVLPGSLSCGNDPEGLPSAIYDPVGAPPGTTAFTNILSGTSPGALLIGNSLSTTGGGVINYSAGTINFPLLTHTGMDTSKMYVGDVTNQVKIVDILSCNAVTEKIRWTGDNWECVTDQGGVSSGQVGVTASDSTFDFLNNKVAVDSSMSKATLNPGANEQLQLSATPPLGNVTPGNNTQSGTFQFSGPALLRVDSQMRVPASTTAPAVDNELKIDTNGDGTLITHAQLTFQTGGIDIYVPVPLGLPTADRQVVRYDVAGQQYIWDRPATVCVSAVDTTCNFLASKLVAGTNITLTPSGAGNETLTISSTAGGGGLGANLSSVDNKLLSDTTLILGGTAGAQNEELEYAFQAANKVTVTSPTGVTEIEHPAITIKASALEATGSGPNVLNGRLQRNGTAVSIDTCVGNQGFDWYDDTQNRHEWCKEATGRPQTLPANKIERVIQLPTTLSDQFFSRVDRAETVASIDCLVGAATSVVLTVQKCNADGGACTNIEAPITCGTTKTTDTGGIDSPAITADSMLRIIVGASVGTPQQVHLAVRFD